MARMRHWVMAWAAWGRAAWPPTSPPELGRAGARLPCAGPAPDTPAWMVPAYQRRRRSGDRIQRG